MKKDTTSVQAPGPGPGAAAHHDLVITEFIDKNLYPFHTYIAKIASTLKDADLDIAVDKIAQAVTALQRREKVLRKEGKYAEN